MFRCQLCGHVVPARTRSNKVVLVSRPKTYAVRGSDRHDRRFRRGAPPPKREYDKGGTGHEIVHEVMACDSCAKSYADRKPVLQES